MQKADILAVLGASFPNAGCWRRSIMVCRGARFLAGRRGLLMKLHVPTASRRGTLLYTLRSCRNEITQGGVIF